MQSATPIAKCAAPDLVRGAKPERALDDIVRRQAGFTAGSHVLVACSGGPDSVALASVMTRIAGPLRLQVSLAHVNHATRPSAWQDEAVALSAGARLGVPVHVRGLDGGRDDEATLRSARYAALADIAHRIGAGDIVTAHTAQDQSETVVLALVRGTGLEGLAGMPVRRSLVEGVDLVRPLLRVAREDLHVELRRSGLPYALDPTNVGGRYRREAAREALARLREAFPHADEAVARCAEIVREELAATPRAAARRALRAELKAAGLLRDVPFERLEAVLDAQRPGGRVFLKSGVELMTGGRS